jgi:DNA-binding Xre family transcriptional regulator
MRIDKELKRRLEGRSLYWLAKQSKVSYMTVWRTAKGSEPSLTTVQKLATALGCQPGDLLVRVEQKARKK